MSYLSRALATAAALLVATSCPAGARSCTVAGNLVPNCGFDVDYVGWNLTTDLPTWVADDCSTGPGCLTLDRWDFNGAIEAITTCMDATPSTYWAFGGSWRLDSGTASSGCFLSLAQYSDGDCTTFLSETIVPRSIGSIWREQLSGLMTSGATQSVKLKLACFSQVEFLVRIDDFFYLPAVFVDGFDAGNTSAWSLSLP
jgi:hypothetical protein